MVMLLLHHGAEVVRSDMADESELLAAVRTDQTSIASVLIDHGMFISMSMVHCTECACIYIQLIFEVTVYMRHLIGYLVSPCYRVYFNNKLIGVS